MPSKTSAMKPRTSSIVSYISHGSTSRLPSLDLPIPDDAPEPDEDDARGWVHLAWDRSCSPE